MFIELIESLRCPRPHEESALIASAQRTVERHIVAGVLGCPVCRAEFPIANGIALFDRPATPTPAEPPSPDLAMRLAAFLNLTDSRGFALLCGRWAAHLDFVLRLADVPLVLVNPADDVPPDVAAGVVLAGDVVPFAAGAARAAALHDAASPAFARSVVRAVRSRGRVLGPAALPVPEGLTELARDDHMWVAEHVATPEPAPRLVTIRRSAG